VIVTVLPAIVTVPVRPKEEVLAATVNEPTPFPTTLAPAVIVIQLTLLEELQLQELEDAVTVTFLNVVLALTEKDKLDNVYEHEGGVAAPAWVTVTVLPATVSVPLRPTDEVLAATEKVTLPFPVPLAPAVIVIQLTLLVAVQAQELDEGVTVTVLLLLAAAPTERLVEDTV
jgi:hypothetical protein